MKTQPNYVRSQQIANNAVFYRIFVIRLQRRGETIVDVGVVPVDKVSSYQLFTPTFSMQQLLNRPPNYYLFTLLLCTPAFVKII